MSAHAKELNKKQKAYQEQTQKAAMFTLNKLVAQFYEVFMDNDPADEAVATKRKQVIAKWKMYCLQQKLNDKALPMCDQAIQSVVDKYLAQLNSKPPEPEVKPTLFARLKKKLGIK